MIALAFAFAAALTADPGPAIDRIFADIAADGPGCAAGVVIYGQLKFARGYGLANVEHRAPITPDTPFQIASVSKSFMAATIALLAEEGKLTLDDDVRRWVPELAPRQPVMRIRHLIDQTSGLRDYLGLFTFAGIHAEGKLDPDDVLNVLARQKSGNFPAGSQFAYSNSNYFVLGIIAERAAGVALADVVRTRIFDPLGMKRSWFAPGPRLIAGRATSYKQADDGSLVARHVMNPLGGEGAMWSTLRDLAIYEANFLENRLGKKDPRFLKMLTDGPDGSYTFGWRVLRDRGRRVVAHGGTWAGFRIFYRRLPEEKLAAIVLCNGFEISANAKSQQMIDVVLGESGGEPVLPPDDDLPAGVKITTDDRRTLPGRYYNEELDTTWTLAFDDDALTVKVWLWPAKRYTKVSEDTFQARDRVRIVIQRDAEGNVRSLTSGYGRARDVKFVPLD